MELSERYPELYEEFMIMTAENGSNRVPDFDWEEAEHEWWIRQGLAE